MPKWCITCGRQKHKGLCDMVTLSDGRVMHRERIEDFTSDIHEEILQGKVKVANRWIKKNDKKLA
jgi:hypothetical protein